MSMEERLEVLSLNPTAPLADPDALSSTSGGAVSQKGSSTSNPNSTKVYYHVDDEPLPYVTEVPVPPDRITLADFKSVLNRSNFKFYCKAIDSVVGTEVKCEIRDDDHLLQKSSNGHFELFLLTAEGSIHSDPPSLSMKRHGVVPGPAPGGYPDFGRNKRNRGRFFDDSTAYTESELRFSDDESRVSTSTDNVTSVSRQHNYYRRRQHRRFRRQPSRASTVSSMTEASMSLQVVHVKLNMDTVNLLGISIVGQSSVRGDNGIYVAQIMPGGAVALDGRIDVGDMILEVNDVSFEKFTNDQAVEFLKDAVAKKGSIKLTVAKSFDSGRNYFVLPAREPTRPIDTRAWVQHTNAMIGLTPMNPIPEGSEGAPTPIPGQFVGNHQNFGRPQSSSTSNGSGGPNTVISGGQMFMHVPKRLDIHSNRRIVAQTMAYPGSGLDVRNRTWLKIPVPMSFLGSALVDWILEYIDGVGDRKEARRYAGDLLRDRLIAHVVNKSSFTEQCYYVFGEACAEAIQLRNEDGSARAVEMPQKTFWVPPSAHSMGDYASLPVSPFPTQQLPTIPGPPVGSLNQLAPRHIDLHSQALSSGSNEGSNSSDQRRKAKYQLPPAPSMSLGLINPIAHIVANHNGSSKTGESGNTNCGFFVDRL